jgi:hypothetical protein
LAVIRNDVHNFFSFEGAYDTADHEEEEDAAENEPPLC